MTGIVPLGAFLVVHLAGWSLAAHRPELLLVHPSRSATLAAGLVLVWLPLAYHAAYGLACWLGLAPAPESSPGARRVCRLSGLPTLLFVAFHAFELALPLWTGTLSVLDLHGALCDALASTTVAGVPWRAALYLAGVASAAVHLSAGMYAACSRWPRLRSRVSERALGLSCGALGLLLFVAGAHAVLYFASGGASVWNRVPATN